ncbi:MAG: type I phosphomannose isomerase catalytic subunit [Planctomycetota bacterium]
MSPLKFRPVLRQYIWGGERLRTKMNKPIGEGRLFPTGEYAESWEVVDHGDDQSVVDGGPHDGKTLSQLIQFEPAMMLGQDLLQRNPGLDHLPVLLKFLDCNRVLSVQVHPDDAFASQMTPPDLGKTEAWYIIDASPDAVIYAGLKSGVKRDDLAAAIAAGETQSVLHTLRPSAGDCVFIPAGTVHALGAGLLVAEIQQSSDTTFRLFDWNRMGADGQPRPLHIDAALEVTDYHSGPVSFQCASPPSEGWETLASCDKFTLQRFCDDGSDVAVANADRFEILTVVAGTFELRWGGQHETLNIGDTRFLPAALKDVTLTAIDPADNADNPSARPQCLRMFV